MWWIVFAIISGGLILLFLEKWSLKDPEKRISYEAGFNDRFVEQNAPIKLNIIITNKRRIPVFYFDIMQHIDTGLIPVDEELKKNHISEHIGTIVLRDSFYVPSKICIKRTYGFMSDKRGCYRIRNATLGVGDFIGIQQSCFSVAILDEVLVLPRRSERNDIPVTLGNLFGDMSVQRFIHEDPILVAGFSDYTGSEPQKAISWTQSARAGQMLVKKYDYTSERNVTIILNIDNAGEYLEECLSVTRTVCEEMEHKRISWGFCSNANLFTSQKAADGMQGIGTNHLYRVLESLSRIDGTKVCDMNDLVSKLCKSDVLSAGYLIIQACDNLENQGCIKELRTVSGSPIYILYAKGGSARC